MRAEFVQPPRGSVASAAAQALILLFGEHLTRERFDAINLFSNTALAQLAHLLAQLLIHSALLDTGTRVLADG